MERTKQDIEDEYLVLSAQQGDRASLNRLLERWQDRLLRLLLSYCHDEAVAWDLLQETLLSIARGLRKLRDPATFRKWVYTLASRRYADYVRREIRRRKATDSLREETQDAPTSPAPTRGIGERVMAALNSLPSEDRHLLCRVYLEDLPQKEVATLLGLPTGTIKSRLFNARRKLKQQLSKLDRHDY